MGQLSTRREMLIESMNVELESEGEDDEEDMISMGSGSSSEGESEIVVWAKDTSGNESEYDKSDVEMIERPHITEVSIEETYEFPPLLLVTPKNEPPQELESPNFKVMNSERSRSGNSSSILLIEGLDDSSIDFNTEEINVNFKGGKQGKR